MIKEINVQTGEVIERERNDKETKANENDLAKEIQLKAEAEAKATARAEILNRLGITAEEAALILG